MDITLEKIELVKDRTGASYKDAKEALEKADGSVVDAIVAIEESINSEFDAENTASFKDSKLVEKAKEIVARGNMARIIVRKDEEILVNFPLTVSIVGVVLVPWGVIFGIVAALGFKCTIEFVTDKGDIVDINGKVIGVFETAKDTGKKVKDDFNAEGGTKDKINDWVNKHQDTIDAVKAKGKEFTELAKDSFDDLKDQAEEYINKKRQDDDFDMSSDSSDSSVSFEDLSAEFDDDLVDELVDEYVDEIVDEKVEELPEENKDK